MTVTSHSLHVRSQPDYKASVVTYIQNGESYTASKVQNGWYYIDAKKGWSNGQYLKVAEVPKPAPKPPPPPPATSPTQPSSKPDKVETKKSPGVIVKLDTSGSAGNNMKTFSGKQENSYGVSEYASLGIAPNGNYVNQTTGAMQWGTAGNPRDVNVNMPAIDFVNFNSSMKEIRKQLNIYDIDDPKKLFTQFNRFRAPMPQNELSRIRPYVFFTRPAINITDMTTGILQPQFNNDPLYKFMYYNNPQILRSLNKSLTSKHYFNPFLSNACMSFDPSDEVIKTMEHGETYTGWKMVYAKNTNESNTAGQLSIQFKDNRNYDVNKMHKVWLDYMNRAFRGAINVPRNVILRKILNYACSIYYIVCAEDGETILYWCKYFGVFPINTGISSLGWQHGALTNATDFTISYMYSMKEDYDPITIGEFNMLSSGSYKFREIYNPGTGMSSHSLAGAPFIDIVQDDGRINYKLRFRHEVD